MKHFLSLCIGSMVSATALLAAAPAGPVPLADFFRPAAFSEIKISPNGTKVAALSKWKDHSNLYVIDLKTKRPVQLTGLDTQDVAGVRWVGDNRLVFTCMEDGYLTGGLFAIDADGRNSQALAPSAKQQANRGAVAIRSTEFLGFYGKSTEDILVVSNERRDMDPDAYRMSVRTGLKQLVAQNPGGVREWLEDRAGKVRLGYGEEGINWFLVYRDGDRGEFREVARGDVRKGELRLLAFTADNKQVYVASSVDRDTEAICLLDPATGKIGAPLFSDPVYDVGDVLTDRATGALLGFAIERERVEFAWTDRTQAELHAMLKAELPGQEIRITSRSLDGRYVTLLAATERTPGCYYFFDTKDLVLEKLVDRAPWIDPRRMAEMRPISYTARDGLPIRGYLTLPPGREPKNLPLIVNPHGGPWARDSWGLIDEVQFLAARGYAVLQVNFRGSIGYGRKFKEAGYGQWGLAMQDDITDGVKWAVAAGIADPSRVGIYGASYGGYAAMAGLAFTPELYRCGVNYVGVTDLALLLKTMPKSWESVRAQVELMTGNAKKDRERMEAASVTKHADQIKAPVFFAYGELDDRIDMRHATKLATQLRQNKVPVKWMTRADEGHGYRRWENKTAFYAELEKFLAEYLAPEPAAFGEIGESKVLEMPVGTPVKE